MTLPVTFENRTQIHELAPGVQLIVPEGITDVSQSLLSFPAVGDTVREETFLSPKGNITKDSQRVAQTLEIPVLLANRQRVGRAALQSMDPEVRVQLYNDAAARRAERLAGIAEANGITAIDAFAESLGAVQMLAVTRADQLPIQRLGSWDAVGWATVPVRQGAPYYGRYMYHGEQSSFIADHPGSGGDGPEWYHPNFLKSVVGGIKMIGRQAVDAADSARILVTDISLHNTLHIRDKLPRIAGLFEFPESSFTMPAAVVNKAAILDQVRLPNNQQRPSDWIITEAPGKAHDSINNIDARLAFIGRTLSLNTAA